MFPTLTARMAKIVAVLLLFVVGITLVSNYSRLPPPEAAGELVVGIRNSPAFYQLEDGVPTGFDYDLAKSFATSLGLKLKVVTASDPDKLVELLRKGRIHIALSVPIVDGTSDLFFSSALREAHYVVAYQADHVGPNDISDLEGRTVTVSAHSPALELLAKLPNKLQTSTQNSADEIGLLAHLSDNKVDIAITDNLHFNIAANFFPDIRVGFTLPGTIKLGWAFADGDNAVYTKALAFLENARANGTLDRLNDRYFGHIRRINELGISRFLEDIRTKLPTYRHDFELAQEITGIDWRLLAAVSYQESKWEPLATSFTGVRGLMMLTDDTADQMGVTNRLDPKQSIRAGAKYLADLVDDLPEEVKEPDRTWLAIAAYNTGMGHMNGARAIALSLGRDPNSWYDMKKVLPLLSRPEFYNRLKSGKARGGEAVIMVENIRTFYDTLSRFESAYKPPLEHGLIGR